MQGHKDFWDKNAGRYDRFMRKDRAAYDEMYELIRPKVKAKTVLELATGTQVERLASCPLYQTMWEAHISVKDDGEVA